MKKALITILLIILSVLPVASADSLSAGTTVPLTITQQNVDNGDGSATNRVYFRFSASLWNEIVNCGYSREDIAGALSLRGYTQVDSTRPYEIVFENFLPYEDVVTDGTSANTQNGFLFDVYSATKNVEDDVSEMQFSIERTFAINLPLVSSGAVDGLECYFVYSTPRRSIQSNATNVITEGETFHHVFRLKGRVSIDISATTINATGWLVVSIIVALIAVGIGVIIALNKKNSVSKDPADV